MGRVQKTAKSSREKISLLGTSVSGLGFAMGSATGKTGQLVTGLANFAGVIGVAGPVGMGLTAAALGVAALVKQYYDMEAATKAAAQAAIDNAKAQVKANQAMLKALAAGGGTPGEVEIERLAIKRMAALRLGQRAKAHALKVEIQEWKQHVVEADYHRKNAQEILAIAEAELKLASGAAKAPATGKAGGDVDTWFDKEIADAKKAAAAEEAAWSLEFSESMVEAEWKLEEEIINKRRDAEREYWDERERLSNEEHGRMTEIGQTSVYWAEQAQGVLQDSMSIMSSAAHEQGAIWGEMIAANERGDKERYAELKKQEADHWSGVAISIGEALSQRAIGEGVILIGKGAGEAALGNAGGIAAMIIGGTMVSAGIAGTIGTGALGGYISGSRSAGPDTDDSPTTRAPTTNIGPGTTGGDQQTIVNYYFGGPVFGNQDDAARAVSSMNERGRRLDGLR